MYFNRVILVGNLVENPKELRNVGTENKVTDFRIAVNDPASKDKDKTLFIDVTAWNRTAELCCQYLAKGQSVLVEGRLEEEKWTAKDGQQRSKIKVVASTVQFGQKGGAKQGGGSQLEETPIDPPKHSWKPKPAPQAAPQPAGLKDYGLETDDSEVPF